MMRQPLEYVPALITRAVEILTQLGMYEPSV